MVKIVDMTSALQQVREKTVSEDHKVKFATKPGEKIAVASYKDKEAAEKFKKDVIAKGGKAIVTSEDLNKDDEKTIKPIIKQLQKSVAAHDAQAKQLKKDISDEKDLEEQRKELEEQLKTAEKELEELYIKEDKAYVIRFKRIKDKERMVVVFRNQHDADMYADNIKKQGGQVFSNKLEKIPFKVVDKK